VRNAATFAEILESHLGCTEVPPPAAPAWTSRPVTAPLFAFDFPLQATRSVHAEAPRPVRLTALERQTLDDARTPAALRHAFMTLARRYHPDSHPGCGPAEHERLARLFSEATEHYRLLSAALDARTH
jgi:hypothetical protein